MNNEVIVTCAVTGAGDTLGKHPEVPVTPEQISNAAIAAAKAGASVAHIHVRDPETGLGSRDVNLFKEVVERIRDSETDVVINLTAGMGGDWVPSDENPSMPGPGTDMIGPEERLAHVKEIQPEICSLDCGTMNFGNGNEIYISPPGYLREMASMIQEWGVKPELEVFELGQIRFAKQMIKEGLINSDIFLLVLTEDILSFSFCQRAFAIAIESKKFNFCDAIRNSNTCQLIVVEYPLFDFGDAIRNISTRQMIASKCVFPNRGDAIRDINAC